MRKRYAVGSALTGAALARAGDEMSGPALLVAGPAFTGSASTGPALLAAITIAAAVGGPLFGVLLDRSARPGRLLAGALAGYAAALAVVLASLGHVPLVDTVIVALGAGLLGPALSGGWTAQLPLVAPPGLLPRVTALDAMTFNAASLAGPALAGLVTGVAGASAGVLVAAALILVAVPGACGLPGVRCGGGGPVGASGCGVSAGASVCELPAGPSVRAQPAVPRSLKSGTPTGARSDPEPGSQPTPLSGPQPAPEPDPQSGPQPRPQPDPRDPDRPVRRTDSRQPPAAPSVLAGLAAGFRAVRHTPPLARATVTSVVSCTGQGMLTACSPLLGARFLGDTRHGVLLLSVVAASALLANAGLARRPRLLHPDTVLVCSTAVLTVALLMTAAAGPPALLLGAAVLAGLGEGPQLTALFAVRHREAPEHLRGQVFTTGASLKITGFALGAGLAGPLAARSLPGALLTAAALQLLAGLLFLGCTLLTCRTGTRTTSAALTPSPHRTPNS
ncbi:integral membrane protein [Streptomyces sp. NRRL F-5755]|uniref:MFS transporter n=1 Tax=Streptomyces sp. NRRL F-5755 TaxID=1519475 RepID=UPI0006C23EDF|nr:MFS transporter [Streptomyces sp. NRRL F-5755]KOU04183.1 integral membrane protein [Streptomyces sp. NRRL F-5755]